MAAVALFVVLYEQPALRRKFGADYEEYCRNVQAWICALPHAGSWIVAKPETISPNDDPELVS